MTTVECSYSYRLGALVGTILRDTMAGSGVSGAELARRLDVTPGAVSQLLRSESDATIKLSSLQRALRALGKDVVIDAVDSTSPAARFSPSGLARSMSEAVQSGDRSFALRLLTQAVQKVSQDPELTSDPIFSVPPQQLPDARWDALFRAHYRNALPSRLAAKLPTERLPEPWFVSDFETLRERARTHTPAHLEAVNVFIDEKSLSRA